MAFKLAKASGVRVPDMVDYVTADATSLPIASIENGILVKFGADGELEQAAPGATAAVAGILVSEGGDMRYAAPGSETYTSTFKSTDNVTWIPVTGSLLIEADISGTASEFKLGLPYKFEATGWTVVGAASVATDDFRVVRLKYAADGTTVTKVLGFFVRPGFFTS